MDVVDEGRVGRHLLDPIARRCDDLPVVGLGYFCLVREFEARDGVRTGRPGVDRVFFKRKKTGSPETNVAL